MALKVKHCLYYNQPKHWRNRNDWGDVQTGNHVVVVRRRCGKEKRLKNVRATNGR